MSSATRSFIIATVALILLVASGVSCAFAGGTASITPQFLFIDGTQRSIPLNVMNPTSETVEVWLEFRYGYNGNDSVNNVTLVMPDSVGPGEPSAASWIRAYPPRFVLSAQESQTIRLLVEPPPGVTSGEYWARVEVVTKPMNGPTVNGRPRRGSSFQMIVRTGVPLMYRVGIVDTRVSLLRPAEFKSDAKNLTILLPLHREGNASFWGSVDCTIKNGSGKQIAQQNFKLAVYKDLVVPMKFDRAQLPAGDYTITMTARSERQDVKANKLIRCEPVSWSLPVRLQ